MLQTNYNTFLLFGLFLALATSAQAEHVLGRSGFFTKNIYQLQTTIYAAFPSASMTEICDNGIDDDGDGLIDCFDPDCSASCLTGNLTRSFLSTSSNYGLFSYDPDPTCNSADWEDDWTKFNAPQGFYMEEYDDGSFIMKGTLENLTDSNDSWQVWIRLHNKRSWTEWSALGRTFYEPSGGGGCSDKHVDWSYYETDETQSRWFGTPGSANDGKIVTIHHSPTDTAKGVQIGFGSSNCSTCSCSDFNVRGWYRMSGDLDLPCGDYGSAMSGYELYNNCTIYNGDFEEGLDHWNSHAGVSISTDAISGDSAGIITGDNTSLTKLRLPATPGYTYTASIWAKIAGAPSDAVLVMQFYDSQLNTLSKYTIGVESTVYQEYILGGIAPPNAFFVSIWGWKEIGGSFYLDNACLEITENYTESNCQNILNNDFETGTLTDWNPWGTVTTSASAYAGNFAGLVYGSDGGISQTFNVVAGETYNFDFYIRATNINGWTSAGITWLDAGGMKIYGVQQTHFTSSYEKYNLIGIAPANAVQATIWFTKTGGGEMYIDDNCFKTFQRLIPTEDCGNGLDDDNDGFIDSYDDDCCAKLSIIPQNNYALHFADSENGAIGAAINAFDGDSETFWHTDFDDFNYPLPHEIQIDLGSVYKIGGFRYLPIRTFEDGRIKDYEVYISSDGTNWGNAVALGTITYSDLGDKEISFPPIEGQYFRLIATSEINNNGWTSAAEINILECKGQEICDDGIDNDGDGLVDCNDPDCSAEVSLFATTAANCGEDITVSANYCITYASIIAHSVGNVTSVNASLFAPDDQGAFIHEVSDGTYTRMVWDFGEVIPDGEEVCLRVLGSSPGVPSDVTIWLLNSGSPASGSYNIVTSQSFTGTEWQDLCFTMPRANRYIMLTDDNGAPFYVDAVGRKCRDQTNLNYQWSTGATSSTISVNGAVTKTYKVTVTSPSSCTAMDSISVVGIMGCPEICNNGIDDDGDGFIDSGDSDCGSNCNESLLFIARHNAEILQVNLNTGLSSVAGTSPFTNSNLNAMAANPDAGLVYYGVGKTVYYWVPTTGTHGVLVNLNGQVGSNESLTSGGGAYFDNSLYLGFEDDTFADYPNIYQVPLSLDGLSTIGNAINLNVPIPTNTSWGDMIVTAENGTLMIYAGLGYNNSSNESLYFKYDIYNGVFTTIRTDMPEAFQLGVDVDGNLWGGGLETGSIQQFEKNTGNFFGPVVHVGGDMWDITGPFNCPQQVEICSNGLDDDGDGRIDSDDDDCNCPTIASSDSQVVDICEGNQVTMTVMTDATSLPFHKVVFYRFSTQQTNPYTANGTKHFLGEFNNTNGVGSITTADFPNTGNSILTYYVYAVLNDEPTDLSDCLPYLEYVINVDPCNEICGDGLDNDSDGDIDMADVDCSGYCSDNGTFLPYGMLTLQNINGAGMYAGQYDFTFDFLNTAYLYWLSGDEFQIKGTVIAYKSGTYVGKYSLTYTATGVSYTTYNGDSVLGSTGGIGKLVSLEPLVTNEDEILMSANLNADGLGLIVHEYSTNDVRIEGDWSLGSWSTNNFINVLVNETDCRTPTEICGNGEDDDADGLIDCADPDCENPNNGGTISGNESNCGSYIPMEITENVNPNGGGIGILEYQWEYSIVPNSWTEIQEAIQATFTPGLINQTTKYRRKIRMGSCNPWLTSNPVTKTVTNAPFTAEILDLPGLLNNDLCALENYVFEATPIAVSNVDYIWDFGPYASPSTSMGIGPHNVVFSTPTDSLSVEFEVILTVNGSNLCVAPDTIRYDLHPLPESTSIDSGDPSFCGASDGWISLTVKGEIGACIAVSLDGGMTYQPDNQLFFNNLQAGDYEIVLRYCDNNCVNFAEFVTLSNPATINLTNDDFANICPGFRYEYNVFFNDDIRGVTNLTLTQDANHGTVTLEDNGNFIYNPDSIACGIDQFSYTVCDPGMHCCETAVVTIDFNDQEAPNLVNVPDDLTISCDEEIPLPALVSASDNCPAIAVDKDEKSTQGEAGCSLFDYTVTYSWIASDYCGNETIDSQLVHVKDFTAPDIYRIYTLPNGKKLVAGVMENVSHRWKSIQFPLDFPTKPLVFAQLSTTNEASPALVRIRNISKNQFEIKLQEETANDNKRSGESVAWFAIEPGTQLVDYQLETALAKIGDGLENINFQQTFAKTPAFFTTMQTILDQDPAYPRNINLSTSNVTVNLQEEISADNAISHPKEDLAFLAIDTTILTDIRGDVFGETGRIGITTNWTTVTLTNEYVNPIVIANGLSKNDNEPAVVQVANVGNQCFDIRIKEWDYQDGNHFPEMVSYIIIEGSVPLNNERFCFYGTDSLSIGVDIVAVDNCDQNVIIDYQEIQSFNGPQIIYSRIWSAVDDCGNQTVLAQDVLCQGVQLRLKALLQGASIADNQNNLMRDDLRKKDLLPLTEPYEDHPKFEHKGGGGEILADSIKNKIGEDACVDWVFIELCDGNNIDSVVATKSALIQRDGDVISEIGDTLIRFNNIPPGSYYIALRHRNHLRILSLYAHTFSPNSQVSIDFSDPFTPVFGIEPNIDLGLDRRALWSGDLNGDERVIYQGPQNDVFSMFIHIVLDTLNKSFLTNYISTGYTDNDFNMDGTIIFQGPNNDKSSLLFNTILNHPDNSNNFSNFVIATHAIAQLSAASDPDSAVPGFDADGDGLQDIIDPDDDNDGVADGNDIDPFDPYSDSDGDKINDNMETGGDGQYDHLIDSDPLDACSPNISINCIGIDQDGDGYFRNYLTTHLLYDPHDENACLPNSDNNSCACPDLDGDGLLVVCLADEQGNFQTKIIPVTALPTYLALGASCGACN